MAQLDLLRKKVVELNYPDSMKMVNGEIEGIGFFPAAWGTSDNSKSLSSKKIMVLGQDQDNEARLEKTKKEGNECYSSTWKNLKTLFHEINIPFESCFFTNCIMGVRLNSKKNTGKSPGLDNPIFVKECSQLLDCQIKLQKPKAIICLGKIPIKFLSLISQDMEFRFIGIDTIKEIDEKNLGFLKNIKFDNIPGFDTINVALTHPSYPNNRK